MSHTRSGDGNIFIIMLSLGTVRTKTPDVADASHAALVPHVALVAKLA